MVYTYYFTSVTVRKVYDIQARAEIDIEQEWYEELRSLDNEENTNEVKQARLRRNSLKNPARYARPILNPEQALSKQEMTEKIDRILSTLTERQYYIIDRVFYDRCKQVDVAREMGISWGAFSKQYNDALKKLHKNFLKII